MTFGNDWVYLIKSNYKYIMQIDQIIQMNLRTRENMESILDRFDVVQINQVVEPFKNNLIWNYCHAIVTQQLLIYGLSDLPMHIESTKINQFRKGTFPSEQVTLQDYEDWKSISHKLSLKILDDYTKGVFKTYKPYTTSYNVTLNNIEEAFIFNNMHEALHLGSCLAIQKYL